MVDTITGNLIIDVILFSIVTGGGAVTLLSLFLDRLTKKREEYLQLTREQIKKFREIEPNFTILGQYYFGLYQLLKTAREQGNRKLKVDESKTCIFYVCNIFDLVSKLSAKGGMVQLDDVWVESIIIDLLRVAYEILQHKDIKHKLTVSDIHRLRNLVDESRDFNSFQFNIEKYSENSIVYGKILQCIVEIQELEHSNSKSLLSDLEKRSNWISRLVYVEVNLMYEIYYGIGQIRRYYLKNSLPRDLLVYLYNEHPEYYDRLHKRGVIKEDVPLWRIS